jgi:hypothetical protein
LWPNIREEFFRDLDKLHGTSGPWDVAVHGVVPLIR